MLSLSPIRDIFPLFPESTFVFLRDLVVRHRQNCKIKTEVYKEPIEMVIVLWL